MIRLSNKGEKTSRIYGVELYPRNPSEWPLELFQHAEMEEQQVILTINSNNETSVIVQTASANVIASAQENGNV